MNRFELYEGISTLHGVKKGYGEDKAYPSHAYMSPFLAHVETAHRILYALSLLSKYLRKLC